MSVPLAELTLLALGLVTAGAIAHRLKLPPALGYVLVGLAASPHALGHGFVPEESVELVAELGVLFLLFLIGLELDLRRLTKALRGAAGMLPFDILVPVALLTSIGRLAGWSVVESLALGLVGAMSSTLFGERLTMRRGVEHASRERVLGVLVAEDVAAVALLAVLVGLGGGGGWQAPVSAVAWLLFVLVILAAVALLVVPRLLDAASRSHQHELVVLLVVALVSGFGYVGYLAGSSELGAFVAGVVAAEAASRYVVRDALAAVRDLSLAVFFLATGLAVDVRDLAAAPLLAAAVAFAFLAAKVMVHAPAAAASGQSPKAALTTALALGTIGEFSLILLGVAEAGGIAHPQLRATILGALMILLLVTPLLLPRAGAIVGLMERLPGPTQRTITWAVSGLRRSGRGGEPGAWRRPARGLFVNLLLLAAWLLFAAWMRPAMAPALEPVHPWAPAGVGLGVTVLGAVLPIRGIVRHYYSLVWKLVGRREGERLGAGKARARLVDAVVLTILVVLLAPVALSFNFGWPVAVAAVVAAVALAIAWRQLSRFHNALESALGRVLGDDPQVEALLGNALKQYPWGVRFAAVGVPADAPVVGQTIQESRLAELTGVLVAVLQRRGREVVNPVPTEVIQAGDNLVLMGDLEQLEKAEALLVSHGEALRLTAQSRAAEVVELHLEPGSPWNGRRLGDVDVRGCSGALVVGLVRPGHQRPQRYDPTMRLEEGMALILLGTPLQLQRSRELAAPAAPVKRAGTPQAVP
ncbi:MAG: cation:proton antiporter [Thermoplasmatota archaeon]